MKLDTNLNPLAGSIQKQSDTGFRGFIKRYKLFSKLNLGKMINKTFRT